MRGVLTTSVLACLWVLLLGTGVSYSQTTQIVAWGANDCGQCTIPLPITDFVAVAGGNAHSLGLKSDGTIVAWGYNDCGQCDVPSPNTDFVAIAAGASYSLGLKSDGTIVAWGCNDFGQCNVPSPNVGFVAIVAGDAHSLGLKSDGSIVAWGDNDFVQCAVPAPNADFVGLGAGSDHSLGLKADGTIAAWGYNGDGECDVPSPNADFVAVAGGGAHSLGLKSDGTIAAWGDNTSGQSVVPAPNEGFVAVAAGNAHSLALKSGGTIVAWGANDYGQIDVPLPNADFVTVAGGAIHSLAISSRAKLFVDQMATGANDGSSWGNAYTDLQSALAPAGSGTSIWVAAGTYKPTNGSDRTAAFQLKNGVWLYGGFVGTESTLLERNWIANETVLSGDIGVGGVSTDNSHHVTIGSGTDSTAVIDGFTITSGTADDDTLGGGGMAIFPGSPTIGNTIFRDNIARMGGGLYSRGNGSRPTLVNVTFSGNSAAELGGGLTNDDYSRLRLINVVFSGNLSGGSGGGLHNRNHSGASLTNVTFSGNAAIAGGAVSNDQYSSTSLINTVLWGDSATTGSEIWNNLGSNTEASYSLVQGSGGSGAGWNPVLGTDAGFNIDADPLFADQFGGNLRLTNGSPAIDAGTDAAPNFPATDLDGNLRINGLAVDMGAYEFQHEVLTGIESDNLPRPFRIVSVSPNPFNPSTTVRFTLPTAMPVTAEVWSVTGAHVVVLARSKWCLAGENQLVWNGRNDQGSAVASGVYFVRIETSLGGTTARAVMLK